jgi:divalent metal cation (Fe/Co/Zn/Cd) transporter
MIALDIEVPGTITIQEAHDIACKSEKSIRNDIDNIFDIMIHVEPAGSCEDEEKYGVKQSDFSG